jgi:hypothetical protein
MTLAGKPFWASLPPEELVPEVRLRAKRYFEAAERLGLVEAWREADAVYFMRDRSSNTQGQMAIKLDLGTRKDTRVQIRIPEVRSLLRQQLAFLMAEKTSFQCVANMGETRSVLSAQLAESAINYVYDESIRPTVRTFAEMCLEFGAAGTHLRWDATKGDDVVEQVPITQPTPMQQPDGSVALVPQTTMAARPAKSGAPFVDALTPFEMAYDPKIGIKAGWAIAFERTNLYALAGQYPEKAELILDASARDEFAQYRLLGAADDQTFGANEGDCIAIHFYYADRPELKGGRYALIVGELVVVDAPCPLSAGRLPVRPLLTSKMSDCAFSFADGWGLHAAETALNKLRSSELTNFAYFGNQARYRFTGTKMAQETLSGGGIRDYEVPPGGQPPGAVQIQPMPPGSSDLKTELISSVTRNSGFTDVSRGSSAERTTSGAHLAGYEAITARNLSLSQGDVVKHEEELGNDLIEMLMKYANTAFIAEIAGREGAPIAKEFSPSDLSSVRRVRAKMVPDAMRGALARLQLLDQTKDIQDPKERAKAVNMVLYGDDEWGKSDSRSLDCIASENERMISGKGGIPEVSPTDDHVAHIFEHKGALDLLRTQDNADPQAVLALTQHIQGHCTSVMQQDPVLARLLGYPDPPVLPGSPAFVFAQSLQQAQMMLNPQPMPGDPNAPPGQQGAPANDQQKPAPKQAQPGAAA